MAMAVTHQRRRKLPQTKPTSSAKNDDYLYDASDDEKEHKSFHDDTLYGKVYSLRRFFLNRCLYLVSACRFCYRQISSRRRRRLTLSHVLLRQDHQNWFDLTLLMFAVLSGLVSLYCFLPHLSSVRFARQHLHWRHPLLRPTTDADLNHRLQVRIPTLDFAANTHLDMGGWMFPHHAFFEPSEPVDIGQPDRGGFSFVGSFGTPRELRPDEKEAFERHRGRMLGGVKRLKEYNEFAEDLEDRPLKCRRPNWKHLYNPSCNGIHEINLAMNYDEDKARLGDDQVFDSFYISHGYYRDVWVVHQPDKNQKSILKMSRWEHDVDIEGLFSDLRDALIMERLTGSPRIINIFGHCGSAVWVEAIPYEVEEVIVPGDGYIKQEDLHDTFELNPQNDYTAEEMLEMAIAMAESLADLHGFEGGVIVHDDVQLCQWLRTREGTLLLGDFNRAEIMDYNEKKGAYCKYNNGHSYGNYRAPEEFAAKDLDEGIDIFTFGNNIYALLTGLWVFYENEDDGVVHKKLIKGETAYMDPRYRDRSYIDGKLIDIMEQCWEYKPENRIDIFEVVRLLREVKTEHERQKNQT